jgi:hypothetical protein
MKPCTLALLLVALAAGAAPPPARAEVARSVSVLVPGMPIALGSADVWPAPAGAEGAVILLPDAARVPPGLAAALAERGHVVVSFAPRAAPDALRVEHDALAFGVLPARAGRAGEAPVLLTDGTGLPRVLKALARPGAPVVRAIVVDARGSFDGPRLPPPDSSFVPPPMIVVLDESAGAMRAEALQLLLAWRARGGDAQQAAAGRSSVALAGLVDDYIGSRTVRRAPRFESALLTDDVEAERALAELAPRATRVVGITQSEVATRMGLAGSPARVLVDKGDGWRVDADLGRTQLLQFGAARGGNGRDRRLYATSLADGQLLVRRHDSKGDVWRPLAMWSPRGDVERVELHDVSGEALIVSVIGAGVVDAFRVDAGREVQPLEPPPGRLDAVAAAHGVVVAVSTADRRQTLWFDARGEWRSLATWPRDASAPVQSILGLAEGGWLLMAANGSSQRIDPLAGAALELDAMATLGTLAEAGASSAQPVDFLHPETANGVLWRPAGWVIDGSALMLWRESSGRHALALAAGLVTLDAAAPTRAGSAHGAGLLLAGRAADGRIRVLRGVLPGLRPPGGWWQADDPKAGGVWLAQGVDHAELHRLDVGVDGASRWRVARARMDGAALVADTHWGDPFASELAVNPAASDQPGPRMDFDPARVAVVCGPSDGGLLGAVLEDPVKPLCLRAGRLPGIRDVPRPRGLWRQPVAESAALVGLADAGPSSPARDVIALMYRDGSGGARWRLGFADPLEGIGVAALSEWRGQIGGKRVDARTPTGLLVYRSGESCGDAPLNVEWRPFAEVGRLAGLPRGLGAHFIRADLPSCY